MPDNSRVLSECWRVLKPGGTLLMHEVVCGPQPEQMRYPVPWAEDAVHSHLVTSQTLQQQLQQAGFANIRLDDWSDEALAWRQRQLQKEDAGHVGRAALSPALILGSRFADMGKNLVLNLEAGAIRVIELVAARS
jgi:SAM-dependent methyltransferase